MDAGLLDMFHDAGHEHIRAVAECVDVDLDRIRQVAVEEQRVRAEHRVDLAGLVVGVAGLHVRRHEARQRVEQVAVERGVGADDRHGAPAQHIGRPHHQRQPERGRDEARLFDRVADAVLGLFQPKLVEQALEPIAVLGEVDRIDRSAEDGDPRSLESGREFQRGLSAELHDDALQGAVGAFGRQNLEHVLRGQRLEIEPVRRVVVGRHRLGVAVDHDRLETGIAQRETGVAAAVIELDTLPDAVRAAAEDHDLVAAGGAALVDRVTRDALVAGLRSAERQARRKAARRWNTYRPWATRTRPRRCRCA